MRLTNAQPHTTRLFCLEYERVQGIVLCSPTCSKSRQTQIQWENLVSFSAQWLSTHVAGTKGHLCLWKQILRGGESRSVAGRRIKHLLLPLWMQWQQRGSAEQRVRKQQAEKWESCDHRDGGRGSQGPKESERQESCRTWRDYWRCPEVLRGSACRFVHFNLQWVPCYLCGFPPPSKNPSSSLCLRTINPLAWMTIVQWPSHHSH